MFKPIAVKAVTPYKIWVKFSDGVEGTVDLSHLVGQGVFASWNETGKFEKVFIDSESQTVAWDENTDLCPDTLYMQITGKTVEEIFPRLYLQHTYA